MMKHRTAKTKTKLTLPRSRTKRKGKVDVTLINLNLMLAKYDSWNDKENYVPLGILYIAAFLEKHGYGVEFIDYQLFSAAAEFNAKAFAKAVGKTAGLVGISCMSNILPFAILCAREIKKLNPDSKIIFGGTGPTPVARSIIEEFPFIDSVANGEGEAVMLDFLRNGVVALPERKIVEDIDSIPIPAYHHINYKLYETAPSLIASRGCPYQCLFCTETTNFDRKVRYRSPELVAVEMKHINSLSDNICFLFQDDNINLDSKHFDRLLDQFTQLPFPVSWKAFSRVDLINKKTIKKMIASGCVQIRFGIESGSNKTLKTLKKGFTIEKAYESVALAVKHFESVHVSFMWGFPFESAEDVKETIAAVDRFKALGATVLLFEFAPLPGSQLYKQYPDNLVFSKNHYSFFVLGGMETVSKDRFESSRNHREMYNVIEKYPHIFPGFYHYNQTDAVREKVQELNIGDGGRTPVLNEYDL